MESLITISFQTRLDILSLIPREAITQVTLQKCMTFVSPVVLSIADKRIDDGIVRVDYITSISASRLADLYTDCANECASLITSWGIGFRQSKPQSTMTSKVSTI